MIELITILGPTATGKTKLAAHLAVQIQGEIISADSRQVYKNLDIGTGKDLVDYRIGESVVPYHAIDITDLSFEYNLFDFQQYFLKAYHEIRQRNKTPILCGGTGLYLESVLKGYNLQKTPENPQLRSNLVQKTDEELVLLLSKFRKLHNKTDTEDRERLIRAIEIAYHEQQQPEIMFPTIHSLVFGVMLDRQAIKDKITSRLKERLQHGMVDEVDALLKAEVPTERLFRLGLEYRFITQYLVGEFNYNDMFQKLNAAIHAFAKRQMTWFRKMERDGLKIHWINGNLKVEDPLKRILSIMEHSE